MTNSLRQSIVFTEPVLAAFGTPLGNTRYPQMFYNRDKGATTKAVPVSGVYSGSPTKIQMRATLVADDSVVVNWTDVIASPSGGTFTGTFTIPQGGPYWIDARDSAIPGTTCRMWTQIKVGVAVLTFGQSQWVKCYGPKAATPAAVSGLLSRYAGGSLRGHYSLDLAKQPDETALNQGIEDYGNDTMIHMGNLVVAACGFPIEFLEFSIEGIPITNFVSVANGGQGSAWSNLTTNLARSNVYPDFEIWAWDQGGTDAVNGTTKATYKSSFATVKSQIETLVGRTGSDITALVCPLQGGSASATDADMDTIRQALLEIVDTNAGGNIRWGGALYDCVRNADNTHYDAVTGGYFRGRRRLACDINKTLGYATYGSDGPKFAGTLTASAATQTINLPITQDGGTALLDKNGSATGAGISSFRVFANGVQATISSTAYSGNNIRLTLTGGSFVAGDTIAVDYMYGSTVTTNPTYDNNTVPGDTLGRPLQPTRGQISGTAGA